MKKLILGIASITCFIAVSFGQCTPDPLYNDSTFGAWPDTIQNFPHAAQGFYYSEVLNFKVPLDGGDVDPQYTGVPIDSFEVVNVVGLPTCMSFACNNSRCSYLGGANGCAELFGTCNTPGTYNVTISAKGWTKVGIVFSVPYDFEGYKIVVGATGIESVTAQDFYAQQNSPNPFYGTTQIEFYTKNTGLTSFQVYDLIGNLVYSTSKPASYGNNYIAFDASGLSSGIYMYTLKQGNNVVTKKMTVAAE